MCFLEWGGLSQRWGFCTVSSHAPGFVKTRNSETGSEWKMNSVGNDVVANHEARLSKKLGFEVMF